MMIKVPLSTVTGNEFAVYINHEGTVKQLKQLLEKEYNLNSHFIKLIFKATILPDNRKIKDIDITGNSCIFVHQSNLRVTRPTTPGPLPSKNPESKHSHKPIPSPEHINTEQSQKSPNLNPNNNQDFSILVENLKGLGFEQKICEEALKISNNDVNAAATLLLSGEMNNLQSTNQQNHKRQQSLTVEDELDQMLVKYKKLTAEQQAAVDRLQKLGFDIVTVMQVYFACGKNEKVAQDCLLTM